MTLHFEASSVNKATLRAYQDNSMKPILDQPIQYLQYTVCLHIESCIDSENPYDIL